MPFRECLGHDHDSDRLRGRVRGRVAASCSWPARCQWVQTPSTCGLCPPFRVVCAFCCRVAWRHTARFPARRCRRPLVCRKGVDQTVRRAARVLVTFRQTLEGSKRGSFLPLGHSSVNAVCRCAAPPARAEGVAPRALTSLSYSVASNTGASVPRARPRAQRPGASLALLVALHLGRGTKTRLVKAGAIRAIWRRGRAGT